MARMTIKIDLYEAEDGSIQSRVAVGVNSQGTKSFALLDHMYRKVDECMVQAREQLVSQSKLQDLTPTIREKKKGALRKISKRA